jgi:hypothetical protein
MSEKIIRERLEIQDSYQPAIKRILKTLAKGKIPVLIDTYKNMNASTNWNSGLRLNSFEEVDEKFLKQNITFLNQAKHLAKYAEDSRPEVQPLLYYYAEQSLFAFFVYSLFHYDKSTRNHGLGMNLDDIQELEQISVAVKVDGFFNRIFDAYSLLIQSKQKFLPFIQNNSSIQANDQQDAFTPGKSFSLKQLIACRTETNEPPGSETDIIDFSMLFYASSLVRYKPYFWMKIAAGREELYYFNECFARYNRLYKRLLEELCYIHNYGPTGIILQESDIDYTNQHSVTTINY